MRFMMMDLFRSRGHCGSVWAGIRPKAIPERQNNSVRSNLRPIPDRPMPLLDRALYSDHTPIVSVWRSAGCTSTPFSHPKNRSSHQFDGFRIGRSNVVGSDGVGLHVVSPSLHSSTVLPQKIDRSAKNTQKFHTKINPAPPGSTHIPTPSTL
jgi:hypothetical protein